MKAILLLVLSLIVAIDSFGQKLVPDEDPNTSIHTKFDSEIKEFGDILIELDQQQTNAKKESLEQYLLKSQLLQKRLNTWYYEFRKEFDAPASILNFVYFDNAVTPRLSGREIHVGRGGEFTTLGDALINCKIGDTIILGPESIPVGQALRTRGTKIQDVEVRGHAKGSKIVNEEEIDFRNLKDGCKRVQFTNIEFDCRDDEINLGRNSLVRFRNCKFSNYNSGAGGSNALYGNNVVLLIENCEFEGRTGRSKDHGFGNAFDFRGSDYVYLRNTHFVLNQEIARSIRYLVADNCKATSKKEGWARNMLSAVTMYSRNSDLEVGNKINFEHSIDDPNFFEFLSTSSSKRNNNSPFAKLLNRYQTIDLENNPRYWIGMMKSPERSIRSKAAKRVEQLLGQKLDLPKDVALEKTDEKQIKELIAQLNDSAHAIRERATESLMSLGTHVTPFLEKAKDNGSLEQQARIGEILASFAEDPDLKYTKEAGRMLNWFEENQSDLIYNSRSDTFQKKK